MAVVYFDQHLGAAHSKRWSKWPFSAFLRSAQHPNAGRNTQHMAVVLSVGNTLINKAKNRNREMQLLPFQKMITNNNNAQSWKQLQQTKKGLHKYLPYWQANIYYAHFLLFHLDVNTLCYNILYQKFIIFYWNYTVIQ